VSFIINPYVFGGATADPKLSFVDLLLNLEGANNSTTFTDLSPANRGNATVNGDAKVTTSSPISGFASSLVTDGTGDDIRFNDFGSHLLNKPNDAGAKWCIEILWKPGGAGSDGDVMGTSWVGSPNFGWLWIALADGSFRFYANTSTVASFDFTTATGLWSTSGGPYYLCLESDGTKIRFYMALWGTDTVATMVASNTPSTNRSMSGGEGAFVLSNAGFAGYSSGKWNHLRITNGDYRYATDTAYTLPTIPFPQS
jgi:hypothetical protein